MKTILIVAASFTIGLLAGTAGPRLWAFSKAHRRAPTGQEISGQVQATVRTGAAAVAKAVAAAVPAAADAAAQAGAKTEPDAKPEPATDTAAKAGGKAEPETGQEPAKDADAKPVTDAAALVMDRLAAAADSTSPPGVTLAASRGPAAAAAGPGPLDVAIQRLSDIAVELLR